MLLGWALLVSTSSSSYLPIAGSEASTGREAWQGMQGDPQLGTASDSAQSKFLPSSRQFARAWGRFSVRCPANAYPQAFRPMAEGAFPRMKCARNVEGARLWEEGRREDRSRGKSPRERTVNDWRFGLFSARRRQTRARERARHYTIDLSCGMAWHFACRKGPNRDLDSAGIRPPRSAGSVFQFSHIW